MGVFQTKGMCEFVTATASTDRQYFGLTKLEIEVKTAARKIYVNDATGLLDRKHQLARSRYDGPHAVVNVAHRIAESKISSANPEGGIVKKRGGIPYAPAIAAGALAAIWQQEIFTLLGMGLG